MTLRTKAANPYPSTEELKAKAKVKALSGGDIRLLMKRSGVSIRLLATVWPGGTPAVRTLRAEGTSKGNSELVLWTITDRLDVEARAEAEEKEYLKERRL